jgi:pimeloyl-ACP methyl ester carboxylesterase
MTMSTVTDTMTLTSPDGTDVKALAEGSGPTILIVHGGLDDGSSWEKVAARLTPRFRVVRVVRRQYRVDLPPLSPYSMDAEVDTVLTVAGSIPGPMVIVGHSSGGVVALETIAAAPARLTDGPEKFAGAVLYEPPVVTGPPDPGDDRLKRAQAMMDAGKPGRAMQIFISEIVGMPAPAAVAMRTAVAANSRLRALAPRQLTDMDGLSVRLDAYASIGIPVLLLGGDQSPAHLGEKLDVLAATLPNTDKVIMAGRDHGANQRAPEDLAARIAVFADQILR